MTVHQVCESVIKLGAGPTVVGEVIGWTIDQNATRKDQSTIGNCEKKWGTGPITYAGTMVAHYDPSDVGQLLIVLGGQDQEMIIEIGQDTGDPILTSPATGFTGANIDGSNREGDTVVTFIWHANSGIQVTQQV